MAKAEEASIKSDPKTLDRVNWQDVRVLVDNEACHPDWKSALYRLHRTGRINNDQREAGDQYATLIRDYRKLWVDPMGQVVMYRTTDKAHEKRCEATRDVEYVQGMIVADALEEESEFAIKRAQRLGKRYKEARGVAGTVANLLEDLLIDGIWPVGYRGQREIGHALTRLYYFFNTGNKR